MTATTETLPGGSAPAAVMPAVPATPPTSAIDALELPAALATGPAVKFEFDAAFQAKIAAMMMRDMAFMQRTDGLIKPEYFQSTSDALLVDLTLRYFEKYRRTPADRTIYGAVVKESVISGGMKNEQAKVVIERIKQLFALDISDRDYVIDAVATFAQHQAIASAMEESIRKLDKRDFPFIAKVMKAALDVGAHSDSNAYDYGEEIKSRTGIRLERAAGKLPPAGITTGYPVIDSRLYHGGWGKKELSVIMGGAKAGKTTALIDFGINAIGAGKNVLYVTLEVGKDIIADRMDSNISTQAIRELGDHVHGVREAVEKFMTKAGRFVIHEFPSGAMTVTELRRLLERYKGRGVKFDMVVLDYADLMAPEHRTDSTTENSKSVYVNLRGLAMQEDIAVLTATQTNREGYKATVAKAEHVAEDFNKIRIADIVISINRTDEERTVKQARLYFAASRNQEGDFTIRIEQALDRMKFISKVLGTD